MENRTPAFSVQAKCATTITKSPSYLIFRFPLLYLLLRPEWEAFSMLRRTINHTLHANRRRALIASGLI
jgi:hypothetical protein